MNYQELVNEIAQTAELTKTAAGTAVDATLKAITQALAANDEVRLTGFGIFSIASRGERTGRNPRTGETVTLAASKSAKFKPAKALKDALNA